MQDCWLRVLNTEGRWEDFASFLADDDAEAIALARRLAPTSVIQVWRGERRLRLPKTAP
ncbi:MAG: hypothetical protein JSR98_21635 [Proteobacteria bacterium]|nr:hypothetical protein [Pseudomonadota bacterium]